MNSVRAGTVARVWRATATGDGASAYRQHFARRVAPELARVPGNRGAELWERHGHDDLVEITVVSWWDNNDAIHLFAGDPIDAAVVLPEAKQHLTSFDVTVAHHRITARAGW